MYIYFNVWGNDHFSRVVVVPTLLVVDEPTCYRFLLSWLMFDVGVDFHKRRTEMRYEVWRVYIPLSNLKQDTEAKFMRGFYAENEASRCKDELNEKRTDEEKASVCYVVREIRS